jgi:hypothetical protein
MATSPRPTRASSLHSVIEAYLAEQRDKSVFLDEATVKLLTRLAGSDAAAKAFKHFERIHAAVPRISNVLGVNIVHWCIMARLSMDDHRGFRAELAKAEQTTVVTDRVDKHVTELRKVVDPRNIPRLGKFLSQEAIEELKGWVASGSDWVAARRREAKDIELRLDASRKRHIDKAAENAAIWALAANITFATGEPHEAQVANLAEVILDKPVSVERVHAVLRSYKPRFAARIRRRQAPEVRG